jgi:hypothetical protein
MRSKSRKNPRREAEKKRPTLGLLRGAKKIADYVFDDETQFKSIYALKEQLGLFMLNGQVCGRPETIDARIAARETEASGKAA